MTVLLPDIHSDINVRKGGYFPRHAQLNSAQQMPLLVACVLKNDTNICSGLQPSRAKKIPCLSVFMFVVRHVLLTDARTRRAFAASVYGPACELCVTFRWLPPHSCYFRAQYERERIFMKSNRLLWDSKYLYYYNKNQSEDILHFCSKSKNRDHKQIKSESNSLTKGHQNYTIHIFYFCYSALSHCYA